jgi:PAS domain S-box-containing protein
MAKHLASFSLLMLLAFPLSVSAGPRHVLLLHSYEREHAPYDAFVGNFRTELTRDSKEQIKFYDVSLQLAGSVENPPDGPVLDYMHAMLTDQRLDLMVTIGGPAAKFAQKNRQKLFPSTPMLFAAVDQRHMDVAALSPNDSVVSVLSDPVLMANTILQILPQTNNVFVVIGNSPLENFWRDENVREFERFKGRLAFVYLNELSFDEILKRSAVLPPNSVIYYQLLSVDAKGVAQTEPRVLRELRAVANAPIFGLQDYQLGSGIVGGPLLAIDTLSRKTAGIAVRIMDGESPEHLRLAPQPPGPQVFDSRELRRWGISEDRLPPDSIVQFRELSVWEQYKWQIFAAVFVCLLEGLLIVALIANLIRRLIAEHSLSESANRLEAILGTAAEGILTFNDRGFIESANASAGNIFGYAADEMPGRNISMVLPALFDTAREESVPNNGRLISPVIKGSVLEASGRRKDGSMFPIDLVVNEVVLADRRIFTGFVRDITERKQVQLMQREFGKQLLQAQEAERARLARELHDDITQRIGLLAMNADRLDSEADLIEQRKTIREIRDSLIVLSEDVHSLAYKLHPALLERLGLAAALRTECERFSRQESISVDVQLDGLPADIPHEALLCLFRVAQEALRNISRHAHAQEVQVSLHFLNGGLQLTVADNGAGFDPGKERQQASLGLASMRERVRLLEGKLEIESERGRGTTILAWIPIKAHDLQDTANTENVESAVSNGAQTASHTVRVES